jgi:hypothetical protein
MISPSNTYSGLTRGPASDLESLYPSGERNFVRIAAADHLLAVAEIELAKELGRRACSSSATSTVWPPTRRAARNLGLDVAGAAPPEPRRSRLCPLARKIARTRPEAVAIFGIYERNEGELLRDLRAALGPDVPLIANDGFMIPDGLVKAAGPGCQGDVPRRVRRARRRAPARGGEVPRAVRGRPGRRTDSVARRRRARRRPRSCSTRSPAPTARARR